GVTAMSWLAGAPQPTVFLVYAWGALLLARLTGADARGRRLRAIADFATGLGLGTVAGMVTLLPARALAAIGTREAHGLEVARMFPFGFGVRTLRAVLQPGGTAGFGLAALALAALGALAARERRLRPVVAWCAGTIALTACFAVGPFRPKTFAL